MMKILLTANDDGRLLKIECDFIDSASYKSMLDQAALELGENHGLCRAGDLDPTKVNGVRVIDPV